MSTKLDNRFIAEINSMLPQAEALEMIRAIEECPPAVAVRFNNAKGFTAPSHGARVPWCDNGAYLLSRPQFTFDPHFHAGGYYVQDPSSMFISHVIRSVVKSPVKYLDLCAAPGGKTTTALQALPSGSIVVANEIVPTRAQVLRENVIKWGAAGCMVTCDSPKTFGTLSNEFDIIAADVPCSGEGMFRKDEQAVSQWSPHLVEQCATRQRAILSDVWSALKPGGLLIYSTCTFNIHENEEIVDYILGTFGASVVDIPTRDSWRIHPAIDRHYHCYRFLPHLTHGEGLFLCVLQKSCQSSVVNSQSSVVNSQSSIVNSQSSATNHKPSTKNHKPKTLNQIPADVRTWVDHDFSIWNNYGTLTAMNDSIKSAHEAGFDCLHTVKPPGVEVGILKGNKLVPSHELAMWSHISRDAFPTCELDYCRALAYLRGEAISIDAPMGHVLVTYRGSILGFVNNLGSRANNLYPKPWRIRSSYTPDRPPLVCDMKS